ncbi:hypothetical protein FRC07_008793 [Ceratobasidium sp. 392]|nr:hypothetical protein FRC07_008793 [Ceratobasidium sp. 392]
MATKRGAQAAESPRAAKSAKVNSKDAATSKKPASKAKASEKPASKAKAAEKPASKAKAPASKKAGKAKAKALSQEDFKSKALPLHVNITHTPPKLAESTEESAEPSSSDSGFVASVALQPSTFATGSYGWKGSRRLTIPVNGKDGETVTVMININATVAGSKDASATAEKEDLAAAVKEDLASDSDSD